MEESFCKCKQILEKYGQEHLLAFYDELDDDKKAMLLKQILQIDFEEMKNLYENSFLDDYDPNAIVSPLPHIKKSKLSNEEIARFEKIGIDSIKRGEIAVITLAGGQGTRLRSLRT